MTTMTCKHDRTRETGTYGYSGPVAREENRAAHGGVCASEECLDCGSRRTSNRNGWHVEEGPWGPTRAQREHEAREAERVVRALCDRRPSSLTLQRASDTVVVSIDDEGYLLVDGRGARPSAEQIYASIPALVDYARELRLAAIEAARQRAAV